MVCLNVMNSYYPPFRLVRPLAYLRGLPVLVCSPHSGSHYPVDMVAASRLGITALRRSEDAFVDQLIEAAPTMGMTSLCAQYARAYVDLNRAASEIDPQLFGERVAATLRCQMNDAVSGHLRANERINAGLGVIPRVVGQGFAIYNRKLTLAEADSRLTSVYHPWHTTLQAEMQELIRLYGVAVLLDWHSMPSDLPGTKRSQKASHIVLGDRWGKSCHPSLSAAVAAAFQDQGLAVTFNAPYAGGYTTEVYGQPQRGFHVLQIEIDRGLYMDEEKIVPNAGFAKLQAQITSVLAAIARRLPFSSHLQQAAE